MDSKKSDGKLIAVVLYPGISALELVGTTSVLNGLGLKTGFKTVTMGKSRDAVNADTLLELVPESTFAEAPHPHALIVPGGTAPTLRAVSNPTIRGYVRMAAEVVGSVCSGSLILAAV